ncbi:MAG: hypothetical protein G01um101419_809 [Parcubacteria group bacterium Gr01-1014_19]|nr:MAG: hypothetical protein G01um101419_809 [Parcubacteria group bacterium Gr01-1014_19]
MSNEKPNVIIVHGCPDNQEKASYNKHWMPWTKDELVEAGLHVETPLMPNPWAPVYEDYKKEFEKYHVSENTILVGHSCGCAFLVRWLGETKQKVKKLILVAPWKIANGSDKFRQEFYDYPIDKTIKSRVDEIIMFTADDEDEDGKKSLKMYHDVLGGKIINLPNHGHYIDEDMGTDKFPELRDAILEEEDEDEEEDEEEESENKSSKTSKAKSAIKNMAMMAATAAVSVALGAYAGVTICKNSTPTLAPIPAPAPSPVVSTKPAPAPAPAASAVVPPRSTIPPTSPPVEPASVPPSEPPVPPSSDGTTP